jgi:hypothetical protein
VTILSQDDPKIEKELFDGSKVEILGETFEPGEQELQQPYNWRSKLGNRDQMIGYLKTALRYWYAKEGYGSEKRKKPA